MTLKKALKYISVYITIGVMVCSLGQKIHSHTNVDSLLLVIANQDDSFEKVDNLLTLTLSYKNTDNYDSAMIFSDKALALAEKLEYLEGIADALYRKSQIYERIGNINNAIDVADRYLKLCDSLEYRARLAKGNYHMGNLVRFTSSKKQAIDYYKKSLPYYTSKKDSLGLYAHYNSIGSFYMRMADYDSAAVYYHKAIHVYENMGGEKRLGVLFANLGKVYHMLDDFDNARKYLTLSLEYSEKYENYRTMASTITKLGNLSMDQKLYDEALGYYMRSESIHDQNKNMDVLGLSHLYLDYGVVYRYLNNFDLAMEYINKALRYYREHDIAEGMIAAWQTKAYAFMDRKQYKQALTYLDSCVLKSQLTGDMLRLKEALHTCANIYYESNDCKQAFNYLIRYYSLKDSIFSLEQTEIVNELLLKYEKEKDRIQMLEKDVKILRINKLRNIYLFTGLGIFAVSIFLIIYIRQTARKNRIISEQRIIQLEEEKKLLAARFLVEGQEEERKRIATELHDGLGVLLSATKLQFTSIKDVKPENKPLIEKATQFLEQATSDVRKISHNMMPGLLTKLGLCEALEDLFEKLEDTEGMDAVCEIQGAHERLPQNQEIMIYRIVQEMVNNTLKHSGAKKISLRINVLPSKLDILFSDNGKGFDLDKMLEKKSIGLQSIISRVKFLNGTVSINSSPGKGTEFAMQIPVSGEG